MNHVDEGIVGDGEEIPGTTKPCISFESMRHLYEMRSNNILCDAAIKLDDQSTFNVHKNILCACSSYFRALFTTSLHADKTTDENCDILIKGIRSPIMEEVINYAYLRQVKIEESNVHELYTVADYCGMAGLMAACVSFMIAKLSPENCITTMMYGR